MSLRLVTAPTTYPVTLAEAKAHLRVDSTDEDTLITAMITAATETAEQITGRAIMTQTWELTLDGFPSEFELTRVPVASVTSVKYLDMDGVQQTLSNALYLVRTADDFGFAKVAPAYNTEWPLAQDSFDSVAVRFVAGYANAAAVPESIKAWVKLTVSAMYENREAEAYSSRAVSTTVKMSFVDGLLDRYKVWA